GHWRLGINGHGSQFMSTQKLCNRRRKTFVDTVPVCSTFKSNSPDVSTMILGIKGTNALSLAAVRQRCWLAPCLVQARLSIACCQVRVAIPLSVPARYALAICRLSTGWRSAWFLASTICAASSLLVVRRLVRLPVVVSTQ